MIAMDVSTENAIFYVCLTVMLLAGMGAYVLVEIFGKRRGEDDE